MDEDTAYVEAVGSPRALSSLQFLGLPIPQDRLGGVLRYQTDHDEVGRATSCGPRTSRLMVQVAGEGSDPARRSDLQPYDRRPPSRRPTARPRRAPACSQFVRNAARTTIRSGFRRSFATSLVIATGGPGELYRDSVYPRHCFGSLGLALEAGLEAVNLTESQFGIGTSRDDFPGICRAPTCSACPTSIRVDSRGREHNFLGDYYRTTQELASNVFRKGYQWPFHATRMLDFGSSLVDLAIFRETQAGRKVFMDFNRNPLPVPGDAEFDLERLDPDVRAYLENCGALLERPIDRLRKMNPLVDRTLQALQIRHHARSARIRDQQPAHERRSRRRHMGTNEPRGMLRGRRSCRNPWRHASRRRRAQRRPGLRHALRRAHRREFETPPAATASGTRSHREARRSHPRRPESRQLPAQSTRFGRTFRTG